MLKGVGKGVNYATEIHGRLANNSCYCETARERETIQGCNFRCDVTGTESVQQWTLRLSPIVFVDSKGSSISITTP